MNSTGTRAAGPLVKTLFTVAFISGFTAPFVGAVSAPQSLIEQVGAAALHLPSAPQVRVAAPDCA